MRFTLQFPLHHVGEAAVRVVPPAVGEFATRAEAAGFSAIAFTEHPAPTVEWLDGPGGHASLDPFVALGFCAAATSELRLMPYLAVVPYRNPFLLAKAATTVDALSGGRLVMVAGAGYLRGEFEALGVDFGRRLELLDELLPLWSRLCSGESVTAAGAGWRADGVRSVPAAVAPGGPPLWLGGNGGATLRRIAALGDGWSPLMIAPGDEAPWVRNRLETPAALARAVRRLHDLVAEAGRAKVTPAVQVKSPASRVSLSGFSAGALLEHVGELQEAGATDFVIHPMDRDPGAQVELVAAIGEQVIGALR